MHWTCWAVQRNNTLNRKEIHGNGEFFAKFRISFHFGCSVAFIRCHVFCRGNHSEVLRRFGFIKIIERTSKKSHRAVNYLILQTLCVLAQKCKRCKRKKNFLIKIFFTRRFSGREPLVWGWGIWICVCLFFPSDDNLSLLPGLLHGDSVRALSQQIANQSTNNIHNHIVQIERKVELRERERGKN